MAAEFESFYDSDQTEPDKELDLSSWALVLRLTMPHPNSIYLETS
jgi:hypothetical protein